MIFEGMWKGVVFGFSILTLIVIMFFTVFSKIMPGVDDPGDELTPDQM